MKILHLDIESAPHKVYSWGLYNQNISINQIVEPGYTLCWAAKWDNEDKVEFRSIHHDGEESMVWEMWQLLDEADAITTWNGDKFDMPTLNKDFLLYNLGPPSPYKSIDLLKTSRRQFRLASNKLDYVSQQLGIGHKLPHKGMSLWLGCMEGNDEDWEMMKAYNIMDVELLEKVYHRLTPWIKNHPNHALYTDSNKPVCRNCGSMRVQSRGVEHTTSMSYRRFYCTSCGTWMRGRTNILDKEKKENILL